jgi:hypothetical protein
MQPSDVIAMVQQYIQGQWGEDVVEFKKPSHRLAQVVGFSQLKTFLAEKMIPRFKMKGDAALPGAAVAGPIGGGKTFIFEALAAELDLPVLVLKSIRSQWFGQTDVIFERLRRVLESLEKVTQKYESTYFQRAYSKALQPHSYQGNILCRASELPSPLPASHFLRQFGQGDRETINGQDDTATVPQILAMLNGPITHVMLETGSAIYDNVVEAANTRDAVDLIFISVLTRKPTADDRRTAVGEMARAERPGIGFGNIIWALLNTKEFLFVP